MSAQSLGIVNTVSATVGSGVAVSTADGEFSGVSGVSLEALEQPASSTTADIAVNKKVA
jgi:hypothetical protein